MNILTDLTFSIDADEFIALSHCSDISFHHAEEFTDSLRGNLTAVTLTDVERYASTARFNPGTPAQMAERLTRHLMLTNKLLKK